VADYIIADWLFHQRAIVSKRPLTSCNSW